MVFFRTWSQSFLLLEFPNPAVLLAGAHLGLVSLFQDGCRKVFRNIVRKISSSSEKDLEPLNPFRTERFNQQRSGFSVSARRRIFNPSPSYSIISNMAAEKCSEVVRKIASSSSKKEVLESLQELSALINSASCNLRDVSPHIPLDVLFGCFNTSNHEQITLCKWILNKLLPLVKSDVIVSNYHDLIIEGLNHPSVEVRELCLSELQRCSSRSLVNGFQVFQVLLERTDRDLLVYTARYTDR